MNAEGRLGNNICQYMSLAVIRKVFGVRAAITEHMNSQLGSIFPKLSLPVENHKCFPGHAAQDTFIQLYKKLAAKTPSRSRAMFDLQLQHYPLMESVYVSDYPCPAHLLLSLRDQFRHEFAFSEKVLKTARIALDDAVKRVYTDSSAVITIITVHIRRTDYLKHVKNFYKEYPVDMIYFHEAFNFFRNRTDFPVFVVTSDDPQWCKTNLIDHDVVYAGTDPVVDLALQSLGDHHIITDGTFGFIGAFLGRGIIVYPYPNGWPLYPCFNSSILQPITRNNATFVTPHVSVLVHSVTLYMLLQQVQCC
ncbi:galactoside 2-alpha-L-fucosyltransferase SEC1-like [Procambarus clarkii]|uniref:galactoside 2-alpha-L-fucosyltransferase SEC1-like n=1 Tax=Procambarus clarkii TaxID=6728 RepID=UPI003744A5B0